MPRYRITEYRGVNLVGLSASATSTISAENIENARLTATCINQPKGKWQEHNGIHMIGDVEDGNVSIIEELENPLFIEYDLALAFQFATFKKSEVYKAFRDFMILSKTQSHWLDVAYAQLLKETIGIDYYVQLFPGK